MRLERNLKSQFNDIFSHKKHSRLFEKVSLRKVFKLLVLFCCVMLGKRGQLILVVALEIVAAVFASYLLFKVGLSWSSGEGVEKLYFSKDLSLLSDSLFIAPDAAVFYYRDNLSSYDLDFKLNALRVSSGGFDPTGSIHYFVPFRNSSIDSVLRKPEVVVFTSSGPNLSVDVVEDTRLTVFSGRIIDNLDDVKIDGPKQVVVSSRDSSFVSPKQKFFPDLKSVLSGFDVVYSDSLSKVDGVFIAFEKSSNPYALTIRYPVGSDLSINKKSKKLAFLFYGAVDKKFSSPPAPSSVLFDFDQVGLVVGVGDKVEESSLLSSFNTALNDYFGGKDE